MSERIPQEDLERARRTIKRRIAGLLVLAMAADDRGFEYIDGRLKWPPGTAKSWIMAMIEGTAGEMNEVSDLALALGGEIEFVLHRIPAPPLPDEPETK